MRYLIKNGSIIDPAQRVINLGHILVEDGKVSQVFELAEATPDIESEQEDLEVIYAQACVVTPGFTDIHTHLSEPGHELPEVLATTMHAAALGGFTTLCAVPDRSTVCDSPLLVHQMQHMAERSGGLQVDVVGALTWGCRGESLTDMAALVEAGCIALSDGGFPVSDPLLMRGALELSEGTGVPIISHGEDRRLNAGWAMHEGEMSTRLGLPGYPAAAEEAQIARDIALADQTGARIHLCHVSTAGGVELIRQAKLRGVRVTAEVTPHHLTLSDRWVAGALLHHEQHNPPGLPKAKSEDKKRKGKPATKAGMHAPELRSPLLLDPTLLPPFDPSTRVNPPLRSQHHIEALIEGLCDGTIDAVATDHTPRARREKAGAYGDAACGISGLETALGLMLTLVNAGALDLMNVVAKFTEGPATILGRAPSTIRPGSRADIVIFDPEQPWTVDTAAFVSRGKNTPLHGQQLKGQVMLTMAGGEVVFRRGSFGEYSQGKPRPSVLSGILNEDGEEK